MSERYDFAIIGSGFGGSILALVLQRIGYQVVVFDRVTHPRFAIGESSTPIADAILKTLADKYDLPAIEHLASYGSATENLADVVVGMKRGFSYFKHKSGQPFDTDSKTCEQLVVAASASDSLSDTHWLRNKVDAYIASQLNVEGITFYDAATIDSVSRQHDWQIEFVRNETVHNISAKFVIDASGFGGELLRRLQVEKNATPFLTNSRAIYAHWSGVKPWHDMFVGADGDATRHPFRCDRAAVHHLIENGWMWQLAFDNGMTSAGFALDSLSFCELSKLDPVHQWETMCTRYPSLQEQFQNARIATEPPGLIATDRLQFLANQASGDGWAALPSTVGFVDPMHSTGIAHTLSAVERLANIIAQHKPGDSQASIEIENFGLQLRREILHIDRLVFACYQTLDHFDSFVAATMLYFAAAIYTEHHRPAVEHLGFLLESDSRFAQIVHQSLELIRSDRSRKPSMKEFPQRIRELIEPYNLAGLCDQSVQNMYRYTTAPDKSAT